MAIRTTSKRSPPLFGLKDIGPSLSAEHIEALEWFYQHANNEVSWAEMKAHADAGARLVNQAKGIYKPKYTQYALSVRQTLSSPYADLELHHRSDGSWVYPYYQENRDPRQRDKEATNRGLVRCMADGIPVGVLIQTKPSPGVAYLVAGLARVIEWREGYFYLEGYNSSGEPSTALGSPNAALDRAKAETLIPPEPDFDPSQKQDTRERVISEVVRRRGQTKFRKALLSAYGGRCAISGCDAEEALEAAHITPYLGDATNHPQNGLLLRADLHSLFDLGLLSVDPETLRVVLAPDIIESSYASLHGAKLHGPGSPELTPSKAALAEHMKWSGLGPQPASKKQQQ